MKNIQVIDGALNCTYDIFAVSDDDFAAVFPEPGQNIEFSEDFLKRAGQAGVPIWRRLWDVRLEKSKAIGIHGTLFSGLISKKELYPTKRDAEMLDGLPPSWSSKKQKKTVSKPSPPVKEKKKKNQR